MKKRPWSFRKTSCSFLKRTNSNGVALNSLFAREERLAREETPDTRFWRPVLYQLSYSRVCGCKGSVIFGIYKPIYEKYCSLFV